MSPPKLINNTVAALRAAREETQEELANALGVSRQTIISIEQGRYSPSLALALAIANHYNIIDLREIFHVAQHSPNGSARP